MSAFAATVIRCDGCHSLHEERNGYRPTEARMNLVKDGWRSKRNRDLCPDCLREGKKL